MQHKRGIAASTRLQLMLDNFWLDAAGVIGLLHVVGPMAMRNTYRFAARCTPLQVAPAELPTPVAVRILPHMKQMETLGFALVGCYDLGELAIHTKSYVAYFCNPATNDFANVTAVVSPRGVGSYFEFSTRFSNGTVLETNTNGVPPLTPGNPDVRVFRFAEITEPQELFVLHHQLLEKYAGELWPVGETKGLEIQRLVRVLENYGPRHAKIGYMVLADGGGFYRLTWKGAFLMAWRGLLPASLIRQALERQAMRAERRALDVGGVAALQKA
jgi:hypothetical protein